MERSTEIAVDPEVARLRLVANEFLACWRGAAIEQIRALHLAGIIATAESERVHIERLEGFIREHHRYITDGVWTPSRPVEWDWED